MSSTIKNVLCKTCLILIIGFTFLLATHAHAQIQAIEIRVDGDDGLAVPNLPDPGDTWTNAFKYLQDAIDHAEALLLIDPDTPVHLWVAATDPSNPYVPDQDAANPGGTGDKAATFLLDFNNITILGGFAGGETDPLDRDPVNNITVLSGVISNPFEDDCVSGNGDCFENNGTPGCDDANCCSTVCAALPDCCEVVWDSDCADFAFLVCGVCGEPGSGDCFDLDGTGSPGCEDASCCAIVCDIDPYCCETEWDPLCGSLASLSCKGVFHVVTANDVDTSVRIDGFIITKGFADGSIGGLSDRGGGMLIVNGNLAVVRVTFTENRAPVHGGGAMDISGTSNPIVVNTSFIQNTGREAGAIHLENGFSGGTFINCLFSKNISEIEGGAINPGTPGTYTFINCTFADNLTNDISGAGAIYLESGADQLILTNCILWGNVAGGEPNQIDGVLGSVTVTYSDIQGGVPAGATDGGDNIDDDPLFFDADNGDYRLAFGSPCIDEGNNSDVPCDQFDVDQDGFDCNNSTQPTPDLNLLDRIVNELVDMGAYEVEPCPWDLDGNGYVGTGDLLILLSQWGTDGTADFDGSGLVSTGDLLILLFNWGPCPGSGLAEPLTIEEEMDDACLTMDDWYEYYEVMQSSANQATKDRFQCWMEHYIYDCNKCTCTGTSLCPNPDPFDD